MPLAAVAGRFLRRSAVCGISAPLFLCRFSTSSESSFSMADYLVARCGLSPSAAKRLSNSKRLAGVKSAERADAFLSFLRELGVDETHFGRIVRYRPQLLSADIDGTLRPKVEKLRAMGFSAADVADVVAASPLAFVCSNVRTRIEFLRALLPDKSALLKALWRDEALLSEDIQERVSHSVEIFKQRGVPDKNICRTLVLMPRLLRLPAADLRELVDRAEELSFRPSSGLYLEAIRSLLSNKGVLDAKVAAMASCGWSEADFYAAFRRMPHFPHRSAEGQAASARFLIDAGMEPDQIAKCPVLLMMSLERRLAPRLRVLRALAARGLHDGKKSLRSVFCLSDAAFRKRFVLPNLEMVPELEMIMYSSPTPASDISSVSSSSH